MPKLPHVHYRVEPADLHAHLYRITLTLKHPAPQQRVSLPVWIPGSYLVREFSKHLQNLQAKQSRKQLAIKALDKCTWQIDCTSDAPLVLSYEVYAHDPSVRAAFLSAFLNPTSRAAALLVGSLPARTARTLGFPSARIESMFCIRVDSGMPRRCLDMPRALCIWPKAKKRL